MSGGPCPIEVSCRQPGATLFELDKNLVKFPDLQGIPFGLKRQIFIGNSGQDAHIVVELAGQLEVEIGIETKILVVA